MKKIFAIILAVIGLDGAASAASSLTEQVCSDQVKSGLGYLNISADFLPVPGLGTVTSILGQVANDACPVTPDPMFAEINNRIDKISGQVDVLEKKMSETGFAVKETRSELFEHAKKSGVENVDAQFRDFNIAYAKYEKILRGTEGLPGTEHLVGHRFSKLEDYAGGQKFKGVFKNVRELFTETGTYLGAFTRILAGDSPRILKDAFDAKCLKATDISGEVKSTRLECNDTLLELVARYDTAMVKTKAMLIDEINTVLSANLDAAWYQSTDYAIGMQKFNNNLVPWENAEAFVNNTIDKQFMYVSNTLVGKNGSQLYRPLKDFPSNLQKNMQKAYCDKNPSEWYANTPQGKPYIVVTNCAYDNYYDRTFHNSGKTKYYLPKNYLDNKAEDLKVKNVLGVLVPDGADVNPIETEKISIKVDR